MPQDTLLAWVLDDRPVAGSKSLGGGGKVLLKEISVGRLRESLSRLVKDMDQVLTDVKAVGAFRLSEVQFGVDIGVEGGFELVGTAKFSGAGSIKLTFVEAPHQSK